jgi:hypothetical protein
MTTYRWQYGLARRVQVAKADPAPCAQAAQTIDFNGGTR